MRFEDDTRYAGQWHDGQPTGLGTREKPGAERAEGNFISGRLEGLGVRRVLGEPATVQSGEFRANLLEGPGVETVGDQRYAGGFRGGKRNGYGQVSKCRRQGPIGPLGRRKANRINALTSWHGCCAQALQPSCHP